MKINKNFGMPLYKQIAKKIIEQIDIGTYKYGEFIPKEIELCKIFQVSRNTVQKALEILVTDHIITRIKGRGTYVLGKKINQKYTVSLESYHKEMLTEGITPKTILLEKQIVSADKNTSQKLRIALGDPVFMMKRLRYANDIPVLLVVTYIPFLKAKFIYEIDFEKESLYESLKNNNIHISEAQKMLELRECDSYTAKYLEIQVNAPIFYFETLALTIEKEIIEYSCLYYRGDINRFYF